jgi:hypothetical protein
MNKYLLSIPTDASTIEKLIRQIPVNERIPMLKRLEAETWSERFDSVVSRIRKKLKSVKLSDAEINKMCREARQRCHAQRS